MSRTDLAFWYPSLVEAGIPTPRTVLVTAPDDLLMVVDAEIPSRWDAFIQELAAAGNDLGWPCFLRTGYGSGKHEWDRCCFVPSPADLPAHVVALVEWSCTVDFIGLPIDTWAVRELLPTTAAFHAFEGMPVTKERRYFVDGGYVLGWHPYWPPMAIEDSWSPKPDNWRDLLDALNKPTPDETEELTVLSQRVSKAIPGAWSVDWLYADDRGWVCIDMAEADKSFCWTDYPTAPKALS